MKIMFCLLPLLLILSSNVGAGEFNKVLRIGSPAPEWKGLPGTDGKTHSLADLADKDIVVLVFTCNSCPIAVDYEDRIITFAKKFATPESKVALVAVNVNTIPEDRLDKMKERAEKRKFPFPYLYDESQKLAKAYGATITPEFFLLSKDRRIVYMGAFDDKTNAADVKRNYLEDALIAIRNGENPAVSETLARGCRIRFAKDKRD